MRLPQGFGAAFNAGVICAVCLAAWPARALETNLEGILLKVHAASTEREIDSDTEDADENFIVDRAHTRLMERVLADASAPNHTLLLAIYTLNLLRLNQDNTLTFQCTIIERAYDITCDELEAFGAGLFTTAELAGVQLAIETLRTLGLRLDADNYDLTGEQYMAAAGDLDGDGFTNLEEYNAVCGDPEQFVLAAMDEGSTPLTLPCCVNCPLTITTQPEDSTRYTGEAQVFTVAVDGVEGSVEYKWYKDSVLIEGAGEDRLNLGAVEPADSGFYRCVITDSTETVTSRTASLTVADPVTITEQPQSATRLVGQSHQFTVTATNGLGALGYQWRKGGNNTGGNAPVLSFGALEPQDSGNYDVVVSDSRAAYSSNPATLTVLPRLIISGAPEGAKKYVGDSHFFTVSTEGGLISPPAYEWLKNGEPQGGTGQDLLLEPLALADAANYACRVSDGVDTLTTATARLQVVEHVAISLQPVGLTVTEGDAVALRVEVTGGYAPLLYQWYKNDEPTDITRPRLSIEAATIEDAGTYTVSVTDGSDLVVSDPAVLIVNPIVVEEGEGEGVVEGIAEGEGALEGEGLAEGEGQPEGIAEGEGVNEGGAEGEGSPEGIAEGTPEGEGVLEGAEEGLSEGVAEGLIEGVVEGTTEGEGLSEGEGVTEGEGNPDGEGALEGEGANEGEGSVEGEGEGSSALTANIYPFHDATLYESEDGSVANGAGDYFFVGRNGSNLERRATLRFDPTAVLPSNVRILSAELRLNLSRTNAAQDVTLHAVTQEWRSGSSDAPGEEGTGTTAEADDATWLHTGIGDVTWLNPGGDFAPAPLLTQNVPGVGLQVFSSEALTAEVQSWFARNAQNFGLLMRTASNGAGTAQRFDSLDNPVQENWPVLVLTYELTIPEGEPEGEGEGLPEGEGAIEGEGSAEGATEGEGGTEGLAEGEGSPEGATEGEGEGSPNDNAQELLDVFTSLDEDRDGRITIDNARREIPGLTQQAFDALDTDDSGDVSLRELRDATGTPHGSLNVDSVVEYGNVPINVDRDATVFARNQGEGPLTLRATLPENTDFNIISGASLTVAPGQVGNIRIRFIPPAEGAFSTTLAIDTLDGTAPTQVALQGDGVALDVPGCVGDPEGPGGLDLQLILTITLGLIVLSLTLSRSSSGDSQ